MRVFEEKDIGRVVSEIVDCFLRTGMTSLEPARESVEYFAAAVEAEKRRFAQAYLDGLKPFWQKAVHMTNVILGSEQISFNLDDITLDNYSERFKEFCDRSSNLPNELADDIDKTGKTIMKGFRRIAIRLLVEGGLSESDLTIDYDKLNSKYDLRLSSRVTPEIRDEISALSLGMKNDDRAFLATRPALLVAASKEKYIIPDRVMKYTGYKSQLPNMLMMISAHMYDLDRFLENDIDMEERLTEPIKDLPDHPKFAIAAVRGVVMTLFDYTTAFRSRYAKGKIFTLESDTDDGVVLDVSTDTSKLKIAVDYAMRQ